MVYLDSNLTEKERMARDEMINVFNPVLKLILSSAKPYEFEKYGFNSCRQTAIFATAILTELLPEYTFRLYEGEFVESYKGQPISYTHAFTIAYHGDRALLIDISRVSKRLLFMPIEDTLYPHIDEWRKVGLISKTELSLSEMLTPGTVEYFTGKEPLAVLSLIKTLMKDLKNKPEHERNQFRDIMYERYTQIGR